MGTCASDRITANVHTRDGGAVGDGISETDSAVIANLIVVQV